MTFLRDDGAAEAPMLVNSGGGTVTQSLRLLVDQVPGQGVFQLDAAGCVSHWSAGAERLLGLSPVEAVGRHITSIYPDHDGTLERAATAGHEPREGWCVRQDGSRLWAQVLLLPTGDDAGAHDGLMVLVRDYSEQKRLRDSLARGETNHRSLVDLVKVLPAAVYTTDPEGRITLFNDLAVELWGRRPAVGQELWCGSWRIYDADGTPLAHENCPMAVALREGRPVRGHEVMVERPDGTRVLILPHPAPLLDAAGEVVGGINLLLDVTEQRRAAEQVRQRAEELAKLMDMLPVAVWIAQDAACVHIDGNAAGENMLRQGSGSNLSLSAPAQERPPHFKVLHRGRELAPHELPIQWAAANGKPVKDFEEEIVFEDGSRVHAFGSVSPLFDSDGAVRGCVAAFMDVSEMKRLEAELRAKVEELAAADRQKDEFIALLAHELRNPLAPICSGLELMARVPDDGALMNATRESMTRQTRHLVRLVDDLLDVSRLSSGKLALRRERVDLRTVVDSAVEATRPLLVEGGHTLSIDLPDQPLPAFADPTRMSQVMANLLSNAARFTREPGSITLSMGRRGEQIVLSVSDPGIGLAADQLSAVFDMFYQNPGVDAIGAQGLGIGLSLVRRLVDLHGGEVRASSAGPGLGSTFTVALPALNDPLEKPGGVQAEIRHPVGRRVLIADDNVDAASTLKHLLELDGNDVRCAFGGVEAVAVADAYRPDVALIDIGMPEMNGLEVAAWIRSQPWGSGVELIAVTGWGKDVDRERSSKAGFDHHLVKPIELAALQRLLARAT